MEQLTKWSYCALISLQVISVVCFSVMSVQFNRASDTIENGVTRIDMGEQLNVVQGIFACIWASTFLSFTYFMKLRITPLLIVCFLIPNILFVYNLIRNKYTYTLKMTSAEESARISRVNGNSNIVMNAIIGIGILLTIIQSFSSDKQMNLSRKKNGAVVIISAVIVALLSRFMSGAQRIDSYQSKVNLVVRENSVLLSAGMLIFGIYIWTRS